MRNIKSSLVSVVVGVLIGIAPLQSQADIKDELDSLFNDMSNATALGVFETQRRGVISGGRYTTKSKIFDEQLVSFTPPSWKGGCGGIDMFNGSFSFVSADQIVQLLRSVAANAKGYAFQLALDNVCPDCSKHIESFQKKIQELNQHLGNSCQLAQGIVNDATSAFEMKGKTTASIEATTSGLVSDMFSSREETETGRSPEEALGEDQLLQRELIGNIVWQQLKKQNAKAWFTYGDDSLLETMMSLTGTVIRMPPDIDPNYSGDPADAGKTMSLNVKPAKPDILSALLSGGNVKVYKCDSADHCLNPEERSLNVQGVSERIEKLLIGSSSSPGVISKFARNAGSLNEEEKALMANLPAGSGAIIRNLSLLSEDAARIFAMKASNAIALNIVYLTSSELFRAVNIAMSQSDSPYKKKSQDLIREAEARVREDYQVLQSEYGNISELISYYNNLLDNLRKQRYVLDSLANGDRTRG